MGIDYARRTVFVAVMGAILVMSPAIIHAEAIRPFGVSLASPIQAPSATASVAGLRLNLFYARHRNLSGLDFGAGINRLDGSLNGVELGIYNNVGRNTLGAQIGAVNVTGDTLTGLQLGLMNLTEDRMSGTQVGITNKANVVTGVQLGLINTTYELRGLQVGLLNMKQRTRKTFPSSVPFRIVPIVNWTF